MRAPEFWRTRGLASLLLAPAGLAVSAVGRLRAAWARPVRIGVPVICVGNPTVGGAGKTPVAISIARRLAGEGRNPHLVSRGYRGRLIGPARVEPDRHTAADVGDEPLLLARVAPTWIGRDRVAAARLAARAGAGIVVLDDGLQNPALAKDLSLLVIDGGGGFGNGRVMPAGPLREPIERGLARADAAVLIGDDRTGIGPFLAEHVAVLRARLEPRGGTDEIGGRRVVAFAGIARPEKFFDTLREIGCTVVAGHAFPDHHRFRPDEVMRIRDQAAAADAVAVTTAKDAVRLPPAARALVHVLEIGVAWQDEAALAALLRRARRRLSD